MKSVKTKAWFMKKLITYSLLVLLLSSFLMGSMPFNDDSRYILPLCLSGERATDYEIYHQTTNIFIGEYTGEYVFLGTSLYIKLKIKKQLFGNIEGEYAWTGVGYADYTSRWGYHTSADNLIDKSLYFYDRHLEENKGKQYLVPSRKYISVYYPFDVYDTVSNQIFDMEKVWEQIGDRTFDEGTQDRILWENPDAPYHERIKADAIKTFTDYIKYLVNSNPDWQEYTGQKYIQSNNFDDIKEQSEIVVRITPTSFIEDFVKVDTPTREEVYCRVEEVIKGEIEAEKIDVFFIPGTVKMGREYIVCIRSRGSSYEITAKNAVQPVYSVWFYVGIAILTVATVTAAVIIVIIIRRRTKKI